MANELLTSFKAASRQYNHVVFNDRTRQFERAGKRHAIATFFGTADAKRKNQATLAALKDALRIEVSKGGRFSGLKDEAATDSLFAGVDGDKRIKSNTIRSIINEFNREGRTSPDKLRELKDATAKKILLESVPLHASMIDEKIMGMAGLLDAYEGGYDVLKMVVRQLLDCELSGETVDAACGLLKGDGMLSSSCAGNVRIGMINFFLRVGANQSAREAFLDIFRLVNEKKSDRFNQMVGCEFARMVVSLENSSQFNVTESVTYLLAELKRPDSRQNVLVAMDAVPIRAESYETALDFCEWEPEKRTDCQNLLNRQPADVHTVLLAAMKVFGGSRDVFLLQKLVGVQDKIKLLHAYGNLSPENIFRAIEGDQAEIPDFVANAGMSVSAEDLLSCHYADKAAAEVEKLIAAKVLDKTLDEEKRFAVESNALRLMRTLGATAEYAVKVAAELTNSGKTVSAQSLMTEP